MQGNARMCDMIPGQSGIVASLEKGSPIARRLMDLGLVEGSRVKCLGKSLWRDPAAYEICGAVIALRREVCQNVMIREIRPWSA